MVNSGRETEELILAVYPQLREMAARYLRSERSDHTLQATALAHEALLRLFGKSFNQESTQHLLALAGYQMRRILVDHARKHTARKRGGDLCRVTLFELPHATTRDEAFILALNEALDRLGQLDPRSLSIVEMKFFCGFTNLEVARILNLSVGTVETDWQFARSWLFDFLAGHQ